MISRKKPLTENSKELDKIFNILSVTMFYNVENEVEMLKCRNWTVYLPLRNGIKTPHYVCANYNATTISLSN